MAAEFDRGPSQAIASICLRCPRPSKPKAFWTAWGPIFYRGRLDGTARLLGIASDPGPTERIAHRTLVGDAGQRVQGFLAKVGLTRSYLLVNAFPYALHPSWGRSADELLAEPEQKAWRNQFFDAVRPGAVDAIVAFGANAQMALDMWENRPDVPVERVPHPSSRDEDKLLRDWRDAVQRLRQKVTPDPTATRPARTTAHRFGRRTMRRFRGATSRSASRSSSATMRRAGAGVRDTTTASPGRARTTDER